MESALCTLLSALVVLLCSSPECKGQDTVTQPTGDTSATQGHTATILCTFKTSYTSPTLFWYKQEGRGAPRYMMKSFGKSLIKSPEFDKPKFDAERNGTFFSLKIQDVDVTDSAVYYCALQPSGGGGNYKFYFGAGTRLTILNSDVAEPVYYHLEKDDMKLCLATGFSEHDKLFQTGPFTGSNGTFIDRESTDPATKGLYSQVALMSSTDIENYCKESSAVFQDTLQPDPVVNLVSLTVLGLRILFVKTVAINILFTLRLCISR